jgi:general stress protein 26
MPEQDERKFQELLHGVRTVMLTTITPEGRLHARPMGVHLGEGGELWFITALDAEKADDARREEQVNVSVTKGDDLWMSIAGTATVVRDRAKLKELWNPFVEAWFPNGADDPNMGLLRVSR